MAASPAWHLRAGSGCLRARLLRLYMVFYLQNLLVSKHSQPESNINAILIVSVSFEGWIELNTVLDTPPLQHNVRTSPLRNVASVLIAGFGAGCSVTLRCASTDRHFLLASTSSRARRAATSQAMFMRLPPAAFGPAESQAERSQRNPLLPPVSSAPLAVLCRCGIDADAQSGRSSFQDMAASRVNNTVNAAETRVVTCRHRYA